MVYPGGWEQQGDECSHGHSDAFCEYVRTSSRLQCISPWGFHIRTLC